MDSEFPKIVVAAVTLIIIGIACLFARPLGQATHRYAPYVVGGGFIACGVDLLCMYYLGKGGFVIIGLLAAGALFLAVTCLRMVFSGLRYEESVEGTYLLSMTPESDESRKDEHHLMFRYDYDGQQLLAFSKDSFKGAVPKQYNEGDTYRIWVDPCEPTSFRVRRFGDLLPGLAGLVFAFGLIAVICNMFGCSTNGLFAGL